ncbi:MAG: hypothetical protein C4519_28595 [Desulfobacteraceae bacterium]|nr:MAG: hypothetical protein C4519_28595 [Desulfobacteraceae bacterium]
MKHNQETSRRRAPDRRETDYTDYTVSTTEQTQTSAGVIEQAAGGVPQKTGRRLHWLSGLEKRIRANPAPFYLFGFGLMIGGFAIALTRQRKRSILMRDFTGIAEEIGPTGQDAGSQPDVRIKKEANLRAVPGTFKSVHNDQASTEQIFRDQAGIEQSDELSAEAESWAGETSSPMGAGKEEPGESEMLMNRDVDIRLGEEQIRLAERRRKDRRAD